MIWLTITNFLNETLITTLITTVFFHDPITDGNFLSPLVTLSDSIQKTCVKIWLHTRRWPRAQLRVSAVQHDSELPAGLITVKFRLYFVLVIQHWSWYRVTLSKHPEVGFPYVWISLEVILYCTISRSQRKLRLDLENCWLVGYPFLRQLLQRFF